MNMLSLTKQFAFNAIILQISFCSQMVNAYFLAIKVNTKGQERFATNAKKAALPALMVAPATLAAGGIV